jgi:protein-L-isoaspartate O-methyltransferase
MAPSYVHGYDAREGDRLSDQAGALVDMLHVDTQYPSGSLILEAGCGVGAQTVTLADRSPRARVVAVDVASNSVRVARDRLEWLSVDNAYLAQADVFSLPFAPASFDHVFVCFLLEHLMTPADALECLRSVLRPGGTITVIEGDHGSAYFHPDSAAARAAIACQVQLQRQAGGNALVGRQLFPLLTGAGFAGVSVSPRMVYVDGSRPDLIDAFTRKTFTAMIDGVRGAAVSAGLIDDATFAQGVRDLHRTAQLDGVFCYTFFKAVAERRH